LQQSGGGYYQKRWTTKSQLSPAEASLMEKPRMISSKEPTRRVQIDRVLESAVVLNWNDLLKSSHHGVVHIEYGTAPEPSLQYVKIWLSTTGGTWDLICQY
jgi:hypothetical protein